MVYRETERTRARRADARERLLAEARAIVASGGFAALQIAALAERAGVAVGTVYRHFPSKGALCAEVFERASQRELSALTAALSGSGEPVARLDGALRLWITRARQGHVLARALLLEPVDPAVEFARLSLRAAYARTIAGALADGVQAGALPAQDTALSAACVVGALGEGVLGPHGAPRDPAAVDGIVRFCLAAVGAPSPASGGVS